MGGIRCNCLALRQAARKVTQLYDSALTAAGIRSTQYSILSQLRKWPGHPTIGELATNMVMDRATLGHNLKPLKRDRLIRIDVGSDRRSRVVVLTERGVAKADEAKPLWAQAQRRFESELGVSEALQLRQDLSRVSHADFDG
jgi:DNA-binding MarR family transcriptional regulator